jgi:hypothetical protein
MTVNKLRLHAKVTQTVTQNCFDVIVQQPVTEQLAHDKTKSSSGVKMVHIRTSVRIHATKLWDNGR